MSYTENGDAHKNRGAPERTRSWCASDDLGLQWNGCMIGSYNETKPVQMFANVFANIYMACEALDLPTKSDPVEFYIGIIVKMQNTQ